ncbi:NADPH-dependent FMN reductase [Flavobacterium beibuense]|uniref:Putative flavoprotein n=1 Tax=Flavobacterium beibuense TaxID=657326 RepID=A0A444WH28_9FLAO|nr:NAD(P)H-dependent oxidoreductase [Flavobacterium beibuense]RYJ45171.1 putative flavoprotein [Flavobacterium beibuense]
MKILAFGGSSSKNSINKKLATYAANLFEGGNVEILDLNDYELPLFSVDKEKEIGKPELAGKFLEKIESADILVISVAEHNAGMTVAFKNIYDWASRQKKEVFANVPLLLMSTSPGKRGGASSLEAAQISLKWYGGNIKATFSLPSFNENFDVEAGEISNKEYDAALKDIIRNFDYEQNA